MMKDVRIDGRLQRVFVLKESNERIAYIPLKGLHKVDYDRLTEISKRNPANMLEEMRKTKLGNGRNALATYDTVIQVMIIESDSDGIRLKKPEEGINEIELRQQTGNPEVQTSATTDVKEEVVGKPVTVNPPKKRPGRKPVQR